MKMAKTLFAAVAAVALLGAPVVAQEAPSAGQSGGQIASWASMPIGSYVMIGGLIFVVTIAGLVLLDDDDDKTPAAPTTTTTSTTTTTTTTTTSS